MSPYKIILLYFLINSVKSEDVESKVSLTFVIDDTRSMRDDIDEVKREVNAIFDTHLGAAESQIENFVIFTFNDNDDDDDDKHDPGVKFRTSTNDSNTFRLALDDINVYGGGKCPEYSMTGIKAAIENSLKGSFIYVFTDASAKDYYEGENVMRMAQDKQCQVVFVLTGVCEEGYEDQKYLVYEAVANATNGQVFEMEKRDIHQILKYVEENIKGHRDILEKKFFPAGTHKLPVTTDVHNKDLVISASGRTARISSVSNPKGKEAETETLVSLPNNEVIKVPKTESGTYTATITGDGPTSVVASALSGFHFRHGFSVEALSTMVGCTARPVAGVKTNMLIQLFGKFTDIEVVRVNILNTDGNVILSRGMKTTLQLGLFVAEEPFYVPKTTFNIHIIAVDKNTNEDLSRKSQTPITPLNPAVETPKNLEPIVHIEGRPTIYVSDAFSLKCVVQAYPMPEIVWQNSETLEVLPSVVTSESVYDHTSILNMEKARRSARYNCVARNTVGESFDEVDVKPNAYFNIVEIPKDITVEYKNQGQLSCRADAYPPATVSWIFSQKTLQNDSKYQLSEDGTQLTIKNIDFTTAGFYLCEIINVNNRKQLKANVYITGAAKPNIYKKGVKSFSRRVNSTLHLNCNITRGEPAPAITWSYKPFTRLRDYTVIEGSTQDLVVSIVSDADDGYYRCEARNEHGEDQHTFSLRVLYPPTIKETNEVTFAQNKDYIDLKCTTSAVPKPEVTWKFNGQPLRDTKYKITRFHTLKFQASFADAGNYVCEAKNRLGRAERKVTVKVHVPVEMDPPVDSPREALVGDHLELPCVARGNPLPRVRWLWWSGNPAQRSYNVDTVDKEGTLILNRVQTTQQGYYLCSASNNISSSNITYYVRVSAPPKIQNKNPEKTFTAVVGDLALQIPCQASGSPKPHITWLFNDNLVPSDTDWYDISSSGTLTLKNIDKDFAGVYTCNANNKMGYDTESFRVIVESYPKMSETIAEETLTTGSTKEVPCRIPHGLTDHLTWYKSGLILTRGELKITNVTSADAGIYTCRVSTLEKSKSSDVKISVGKPPVFAFEAYYEEIEYEEDNLNFFYEGRTITKDIKGDLLEKIQVDNGDYAVLDCSVDGEPKPKVSWWNKGSHLSPHEDEQIFKFPAAPSEAGVYFCIAENQFETRFIRFEVEVK